MVLGDWLHRVRRSRVADQFPEGTFLGLDLSSRQIQDGQRLIERAGLKNVELRHQDILTAEGRSGFQSIRRGGAIPPDLLVAS